MNELYPRYWIFFIPTPSEKCISWYGGSSNAMRWDPNKRSSVLSGVAGFHIRVPFARVRAGRLSLLRIRVAGEKTQASSFLCWLLLYTLPFSSPCSQERKGKKRGEGEKMYEESIHAFHSPPLHSFPIPQPLLGLQSYSLQPTAYSTPGLLQSMAPSRLMVPSLPSPSLTLEWRIMRGSRRSMLRISSCVDTLASKRMAK